MQGGERMVEGIRTVTWNNRQSSHDSHEESTFADCTSETAIEERVLFDLFTSGGADIFECAKLMHQTPTLVQQSDQSSSLEISNFAEQCSSTDNTKSFPKSPNITAQYSDDFMAKERRERNDEQYPNRNEISKFELLHPVRRRSKPIFDLRMKCGDENGEYPDDEK